MCPDGGHVTRLTSRIMDPRRSGIVRSEVPRVVSIGRVVAVSRVSKLPTWTRDQQSDTLRELLEDTCQRS